MQIKIRNAIREDLAEAANVLVEGFGSVGEEWKLEIAQARLEEYYKPDTFWVAEIDNKIIGILSSKIDYLKDGKELYIDIISVLPKYQKSGAGRLLIDTAINYAETNNLAGIWLIASTKLPSYEWYKKLGLEQSSWGVLYKAFNADE